MLGRLHRPVEARLPERMVLQKGNAAFFLKTIWEMRA